MIERNTTLSNRFMYDPEKPSVAVDGREARNARFAVTATNSGIDCDSFVLMQGETVKIAPFLHLSVALGPPVPTVKGNSPP